LNTKKKIFDNYDQLFQPLISYNKVALFKKEDNTENSHWIYAVRVIGNKKSISETTEFYKNNGVDIRPFFYPINHHGHLTEIENTDEVSYLLNNEIIMIPSSPTITFEQQQTVVNSVYEFILFNQNIRVVKIQKENSNLLDDFIPTINSKYFRYFNKRTSNCIKDHLHTFLFYDISCNIYFGYTHVDFYEKHWFGIYIDDNYRNKKLGNLLLNYTLNSCKINNISDIHLSVDSDNEIAIRLYKKNNFIVNDVTGNITYMAKTL
jgi:GNAT superfamily N-acetyltransferase